MSFEFAYSFDLFLWSKSFLFIEKPQCCFNGLLLSKRLAGIFIVYSFKRSNISSFLAFGIILLTLL